MNSLKNMIFYYKTMQSENYLEILGNMFLLDEVGQYLELPDILMLLFTNKELHKFFNLKQKRLNECENLTFYITSELFKLPHNDNDDDEIVTNLDIKNVLRTMALIDQILFCFRNSYSTETRKFLTKKSFIKVLDTKLNELYKKIMNSYLDIEYKYIFFFWYEEVVHYINHYYNLFSIKNNHSKVLY